MTKKEFEILLLLTENEDGMTQREIARRIGISVGSINKTVKGLTEQGLICDSKITKQGLEALEPYRVKRAIFLAAGFGTRMVPLTFNTPKPLIRVHGVRIIDTLLDAVIAAGIPEIIIVRGYLGEQFDQLLYKDPRIQFYDNPMYNESKNISSAVVVRDLLQNAYVLEADLVLKNPKLIRKYEYCANFLGFPVDVTNDWCVYTDKNGIINEFCVGGTDCHQITGISYWDAQSGAKLAEDLNDVYLSPGGKERFWDQVPLTYKKENYKVAIREYNPEDIVEIDSFNDLKKIDGLYRNG